MTDKSEKRLKKAMDKLYHSPMPRPSSSSSLSISSSGAGGGRRVEAGSRLRLERGSRVPPAAAAASMSALGPPPPCRPWDRGDLMRRLASFKAMTWFAKPKVISPVNCARRGWTNVEADVIICEACGARLLFSTPSSWTLQQVEKAAAVFSLKLDTGHKLLCPWIDNICDESLALFPPTPPALLVENYNECLSSLLRLLALPKVSSSSLEYMKKRSPQVEQFLTEPFSSSIVLKGGFVLTEESNSKDLDDAFEDANVYYQALKIISLCGWEPRLLPYAVDSGPIFCPDAKATPTSNRLEQIHNKKEDRVTICSPNGLDGSEGVEHAPPGDHLYDPASVVLDCRFCGACVALWSFAMVDRPLQLFKLIVDSSRQDEQANRHTDLLGGAEASKAANVGFRFTIAGGLPPTRQNFRPKISFPVVSRHLRAELNSSRKSLSSEGQAVKNTHCLGQNDHHWTHQNGSGEDPIVSEGAGSLKRKRSTDELLTAESGNASTYGSSVDTPTEGITHDQQEDNSEKCAQECLRSDETKSADMEEASRGEKTGSDDTSKTEGSMSTTPEAIITNKDTGRGQLNPVDVPAGSRKTNGFTKSLQSTSNEEKHANQMSGTLALYDRMDEFDPIKQHRTFCPWIAPDDGEASPGWKMTLLALLSQVKGSNGDSQGEVQPSLLDEADDPITSIRKLFMSPPSKKSKSTR